MYIPRPFKADEQAARELLMSLPVGQLITATEHGPLATLLPWVVDFESGALLGHVARPNQQWQTPWRGQALVLFQGPNGYVSPSWYATKAETGRVVPTWNYLVVQVYGELVIHDEQAWVMDVVRRLTHRHEQTRPEPWSVDDAPSEYLNGQLQGIVGIEVRIDRVEASVKMSQNKSLADSAGVAAGFAAEGEDTVAVWVRQASM